MVRPTALLAALLLPLAGLPFPALAQSGSSAQRELSRAELEDLLARYEGARTGGDRDLRQRAEAEAALIRDRLQNGDFKVGDQIALSVQEQAELTDTFSVRAGRVLPLPMVGDVPMEGVLRSELTDHLQQHIGRVIRDPVIRASSLIRIAVEGSIGQPGFYALPSDAVLSDVLMEAGGPSGNANLREIRIERGVGNERIWHGDALQEALAQGRTLDQLSMSSGDRVVVPEGGGSFFRWENLRWMLGAVSTVLFIWRRF